MAVFIDGLASKLAEVLIDLAAGEVSMLLGVSTEINNLHRRINKVQYILADAEHKQFHDESIRSWLKELRDLLYDTEDTIDDYNALETQNLPRQPLARCCSFPLLSCFTELCFRHDIGNRINDLNRRLKEIEGHPAARRLDHGRGSSTHTRITPETSSVPEPDLVGSRIEEDTTTLVRLMTSTDAYGSQDLSVFAIVGMGGIGKTTLAQNIFHHEKLRAHFHPSPLVWVCVSQDYSDIQLLRTVITQAGGKPGNMSTRADLENALYKLIQEKRFFLVLDDVWDAKAWLALLRKPLHGGAAGSRVLVTSRSSKVAMEMGAVHLHNVELLPGKDGWSLLCRKVFHGENEGENIEALHDVGKKIVEKCEGLPLAIVTVTGVLATTERRRSEWEKVLRNEAWSLIGLGDKIGNDTGMGALYLSYQYLPSYLKPCFNYCSLFPEDSVLSCGVLMRFWIAEGFVTAKRGWTQEETANEYWRELVQRNVLQPEPGHYDLSGCRMHGLLRKLLQHLAEGECFHGDFQGLQKERVQSSVDAKIRRLFIVDQKEKGIPEVIFEHKSLRTLVLFRTPLVESVPEKLFRELRLLRVLDLRGAPIVELPESIETLVHLRRLDLSFSQIQMIPGAIKKLRYLEFLILDLCRNLRILPDGIAELSNLRTLDLHETALDRMPTGTGGLQKLSSLNGFVASQDQSNGSDPWKELRYLSALTRLMVHKLERAIWASDAAKDALTNKNHLLDLELHCFTSKDELHSSALLSEPEAVEKIQKVYEGLRAPECVELLTIASYFGRRYPAWLGIASFLPSLRRLELRDCILCEQLPPLGLLPLLDCLVIAGAPAVKIIGLEFLCDDGAATRAQSFHFFPMLKQLRLKYMDNWEEWAVGSHPRMLMPRLKQLVLEYCPKLRSIPKALFHQPAVDVKLSIDRAHSLREIGELASVKKLELLRNEALERFADLPELQSLKIAECPRLKYVGGVAALQHLVWNDRRGELKCQNGCWTESE